MKKTVDELHSTLETMRFKIYDLWIQTNDDDDPFCSQLRLADIMGFNASQLREWINKQHITIKEKDEN